ncbi:MAG: type II toxin-antitoxin system Phd/YefM family antitoxin [Firmicutes bacterium]|nr:type II toxin-antitoxin system Phd/YefM family antitoxin [Bacillota bacterium]
MIISSTEVQNNFGKYLGLANEEDIIISRNGKKVARLVKYFEDNDYTISEGSSIYSHEGKKVSYDEFLKIARESENRYEYIDGQIYLLASPKFRHQMIVIKISSRLLSWFNNSECQPLTSPFDVTLYKDNKANVVQPDLLVICDQENIEGDGSYMGIPTLVVEVLSESSRSKDIIQKMDLYMYGGIEEYWIVNPFSEEVNIYLFKEKQVENILTFKKKEIAKSFIFQGLEMDLTEVFI